MKIVAEARGEGKTTQIVQMALKQTEGTALLVTSTRKRAAGLVKVLRHWHKLLGGKCTAELHVIPLIVLLAGEARGLKGPVHVYYDDADDILSAIAAHSAGGEIKAMSVTFSADEDDDER